MKVLQSLQSLRMDVGGSNLSKDEYLVNSPFKAHGSISTIRLGFTMLQRMQRLSLHPVDEICYRFVFIAIIRIIGRKLNMDNC